MEGCTYENFIKQKQGFSQALVKLDINLSHVCHI